jgi:hypothetical protein
LRSIFARDCLTNKHGKPYGLVKNFRISADFPDLCSRHVGLWLVGLGIARSWLEMDVTDIYANECIEEG